VDFSNSVLGGIGSPFPQSCDYKTKDFCVIDDESGDSGVYVDLRKNPERFTGYDGESAHKIWNAIYEENCFQKFTPIVLFGGEKEEECLEKRVYYKIISGLHSSISV
jgi:ERO1-like protein beta